MPAASPAPAEPAASLRILVVDDDEAVRGSIAYQLDRLGHQVIEACDAQWALELFDRHRPDLVLSDVDMPGFDGCWLARQVRERDQRGWTPLIFLSALGEATSVAAGIAAGADDYLLKPVHPVVLEAKLHAMRRLRDMRSQLEALSEELRCANVELLRQARHDGLTGLLNRRGLDEQLDVAIELSRRNRMPLTVMLCDVDHFKRYNDGLGHHAGDECLRHVGALLRQLARRPMDSVARYGGEEFALVLPDTPRAGARTLAHAITRIFETTALPHPDSPVAAHVTLSGGITTCDPGSATPAATLLQRADEGLYLAKSQGRNRFVSL
ncbi:GGDEF domain-containing response regulator [Pelomonas aquatica]|jgi:diguanylate cyclase (GGDEF)-like protein|uniref:diguanylate cyclase n=1 Tax=Pelomonas aquatica TaxID=431058 RepID=A0A9X4LE71_9BURK|nr:diguanylate cyclase [Pelomonas aquatica]MCY4753304.1 diguanylate cyclase [Pelomonas aquatica]MDG0861381.1 diguanylate cyclase [Pelomonas aquatica]